MVQVRKGDPLAPRTPLVATPMIGTLDEPHHDECHQTRIQHDTALSNGFRANHYNDESRQTLQSTRLKNMLSRGQRA